MALLTGVLNGQPITKLRTALKEPGTNQDILVIDVMLSVAPDYEFDVTQHPVERGSDISDHIKTKNLKISMEGLASETPLDLEASLRGVVTSATAFGGSVVAKRFGSSALGNSAGAIGSAAGSVAGGVVGGLGSLLFTGSSNKAEKARQILIARAQSKKPFDLFVPPNKYANVVFTNISFPKDATTGRAVKFSATMQVLQIATSKIVKIANLKKIIQHSASEEENEGRQSTKDATASRTSLLLKGLQLASGNEGVLK